MLSITYFQFDLANTIESQEIQPILYYRKSESHETYLFEGFSQEMANFTISNNSNLILITRLKEN